MNDKAGAAKAGQSQTIFLGIVLAVGLPAFAIVRLIETYGGGVAALTVGAVVGCGALVLWGQRLRRVAYLRAKYGDAELVGKIVAGRAWIGQDAEQLRDMLGNPVQITRRERGGKAQEVWHYLPYKTYFRLRVTLEDGLVVECGQKA